MHRTFGIELGHDEYTKARGETLLQEFCLTAVGHFIAPPRHRVNRVPKFKDEFSLHYCVQGKGWLDVSGSKVAIMPGMAFACMPDSLHRYQADPNDPWSLYFLHAAGPGIYDYLAWLKISAKQRILNLGQDAILIGKFEETFHAFSKGKTSGSLIYGSQSLRNILGYIGTREGLEKGLGMEMIEISRFIRENLGCPMSLRDLAGKADLSIFHFCREFRKIVGVPPRQFINRVIAEEAGRLLLAEPGLSIKQVAVKVGMHNVTYFSRLFRLHVGVSPLLYRRHHLTNIN